MYVINGILNILFGLFALCLSYSFLSSYFGGTEKEVQVLEGLLHVGDEAMGIIDSVYTEISVGGGTVYSSKYFFKVGDKDYSGDFSFDSPEELNPIIKVLYMPNDPTINETDVEIQLEKARDSERSNSNFILGIGALLVGLFSIYFGGIRKILQPKQAPPEV